MKKLQQTESSKLQEAEINEKNNISSDNPQFEISSTANASDLLQLKGQLLYLDENMDKVAH